MSPDAEHPARGVLAAAAVRALAPYIANHVYNKPNCDKAARGGENKARAGVWQHLLWIRACARSCVAPCFVQVAPPEPITLPPLKTWTFIPVTGQIIARLVVVDSDAAAPTAKAKAKATTTAKAPAAAKATAKATAKAKATASGKEVPSPAAPKGDIAVGTGSEEPAEDEAEDAEEEADDDGGDLEEELKELEAMTDTGTKKRKGAAKSEGATEKKQKKKTAKK